MGKWRSRQGGDKTWGEGSRGRDEACLMWEMISRGGIADGSRGSIPDIRPIGCRMAVCPDASAVT